MKKTLLTILTSVTLIVALGLGSFTNASASPLSSAALQSATVPLHQSHVGATNPGFEVDSCPTPPQAGWWGWHFVMPENNNFTSLTVTFQNAGTFSADPFPGIFMAHPDHSHAYIWTPGPDTLLGGSATSDGDNTFFNLSHVCPGRAPTNTPTQTPTPTDPPTATPTPTDTPTATPTPTDQLGQLKLCKAGGIGVTKGQVFTFSVGITNYSVPAGYCVLAGQYPLNTQVTIRENIPTGYFVESITVGPMDRTVSKNTALGEVVVRIGSGITEVSFKNATATSTSTKTPGPGSPPQGYMEICKQADGAGVSGYFNFRFASQTRSVAVGTCSSLIFNLTPGTLTITEDARAGFQVSDIYTIPADRLISKDLNARSATVTIVPSNGDASTMTVVVFVNRAINQLNSFMQVLRKGR